MGNSPSGAPLGVSARNTKGVFYMTRYQIVYNKSGYPLTTWSNNPDQAHELAEKFRKVGYSVDVWEHTDKGAHKTSL
nr:MAG: hypothetical protein [Bacteriophage sp.]